MRAPLIKKPISSEAAVLVVSTKNWSVCEKEWITSISVIKIITFGIFADFGKIVNIIQQSFQRVASNKWRTPLGLVYNCSLCLLFHQHPYPTITLLVLGFALHKNANSFGTVFYNSAFYLIIIMWMFSFFVVRRSLFLLQERSLILNSYLWCLERSHLFWNCKSTLNTSCVNWVGVVK